MNKSGWEWSGIIEKSRPVNEIKLSEVVDAIHCTCQQSLVTSHSMEIAGMGVGGREVASFCSVELVLLSHSGLKLF